MINDPIAEMLTRVRNGYMVEKPEVMVPHSNIKAKIIEILAKHGYVESYSVEGEGKEKRINLKLKYYKGKPAVTKIVRVSKPGRRVYQKGKKLPRVVSGMGLAIVSTSKGVMIAQDAKKQNLGGEIICKIW